MEFINNVDTDNQKSESPILPNGSSTMKAAVEFAKLCGNLKLTPRTGWVYRKVPKPESVADHSWRVAAMCLLLQSAITSPKLDVSRCMEMALLHDLAEAIIGDIAPGDNISKQEKIRREHEAMTTIADILDRMTTGTELSKSTGEENMSVGAPHTASQRFLAIMKEYEARQTPEAKAVKDLDLLDMIVQAEEYELAHPDIDLQEFFDGTGVERFHTPFLQNMATEVHRQHVARKHLWKHQQPADKHVDGNSAAILPNKDKSTALSAADVAFVEEFSATSGRTIEEIRQVVSALRKKDSLI